MTSLSIVHPDSAGVTYGNNRDSLVGVIRKRRSLALTVFLTMLGLVVLLVIVMPRSYEASMEFLINNERINSPVGPDKNTQAIFYLDEVGEARVNTEVALLTSNDLLTQVVQECHLASYVRTNIRSEDLREEQALKQLKEHLVVSPVKKSAIIEVRYRSADPARSVTVLQTLSRLYLESHLRLRGTTGSSVFFEELWREYSAQQKAAAATLAQYKSEHNIVSLPDEKTLTLQREADLEKQYSDARTAADRSGSQRAELTSVLAITPASLVGERKTIPKHAEMEELSTVLVGLQNKRVEAASRYLPDDRFVKDLDQQIAQTKEALDSATATSTEEVSTVVNPVMSNAQSDSVHAQYELAGYKAQAATLGRQLFDNRKRLAELDAETAAYNILNDNVARLTELDHDYRQKADAARVSQMLDEKHISDVTVAEEPFAPSQAASPKVAAILVAGFLWSLITAVGTVFVVARARARVNSPFDVEVALGAPVLAFVCTGNGSYPRSGLLPQAYFSMTRQPARSTWRIA